MIIRFEEHIKMAYSVANKYFANQMVDRDDIKQLALIGLYKATQNYKEDLGYAFSTYAYKVMHNEISKELKRHSTCCSLDEMEMEIGDNSPSPEEETLGSLEAFKNVLTYQEYEIISLTLQGYNQQEISKVVGLSQSQVSRIYLKAKDKIWEVYHGGSIT